MGRRLQNQKDNLEERIRIIDDLLRDTSMHWDTDEKNKLTDTLINIQLEYKNRYGVYYTPLPKSI